MSRSHIVTACLLAAAVVVPTLIATAQQDNQEKVEAVLASMQAAIGAGNAQDFGRCLADSGFVGAMRLMYETHCYSKSELVEMLDGLFMAGGGAPIAFEDVKIDSHWMVALVEAKLTMPADAGMTEAALDAVMIREGMDWKVAAMVVTDLQDEVDEEQMQPFLARVAALPDSLKAGDASVLDEALDDDHFVMCFVDPSLELRWANSKTAMMQMIQAVIPMVTINESRLDVSRTIMGSGIAVVEGTWVLDITELGQTESTIRAYAVKAGDSWKLVALAGGPKG